MRVLICVAVMMRDPTSSSTSRRRSLIPNGTVTHQKRHGPLIAAARYSVEGERVVQEKIDDLVVNLGKLLDELCAFLRGQLEGRGWYLVRFR